MNDPERRYLEAWLALANRIVEWEHACREKEAPAEMTLTFDSDDQARIVRATGQTDESVVESNVVPGRAS